MCARVKIFHFHFHFHFQFVASDCDFASFLVSIAVLLCALPEGTLVKTCRFYDNKNNFSSSVPLCCLEVIEVYCPV